MNPIPPSHDLSRRERQIMDILFREEESTVRGVWEALPDPPTTSAVRAALRLMVKKGIVTRRRDGPRKVYAPAIQTEVARCSALRHIVETFFEGSRELAVRALLTGDDTRLSREELDRIERLVREVSAEEDEVRAEEVPLEEDDAVHEADS